MSGANKGDNTYFINSFGEPEHLYLRNWYMKPQFGMDKLMGPSTVIAAGVLIVIMTMIIGGVM